MADPKVGEMILFDYIRPPLLAGGYRMRVQTDVTVPGTATPLPGEDFFFDVEGPRFSLAPSEVAAVFPPRNGHGPFDSALPHVALGRRTLPWERPLGDAYTVTGDQTPYPFLALVLFEQSECTILRNQALTDVVPPAVFQRLGRPAGIRCDAVEADEQLLRDILPMPEELQLLTHVRQVNVDDRELAAGDSDGYFAVVMGNRIPRSGASYVACLVSVEERTDLLPTTDVVVGGGWEVYENAEVAQLAEPYEAAASALGTQITAAEADAIRINQHSASFHDAAGPSAGAGAASRPAARGPLPAVADGPAFDQVGRASGAASRAVSDARSVVTLAQADAAALHPAASASIGARDRLVSGGIVLHPPARLVLLHSWTFACEGDGTFRQLMQGLDVAMMGEVDAAAKLAVTDTGHILLDVVDRLGAPEQSWYRGPLVSQPLTRDPLGPYHSADQARRVVAETGAENISYAAAFEAGRLLAAADARLAQELMRWRRGAFRAATRQSSLTLLRQRLRLTEVTDPIDPVALEYTLDVLAKITAGTIAPADPHRLDRILASPLLEPGIVARAFGLETKEEALALLGGDVALGRAIEVRAPEAVLTNLDRVLADQVGLAALADARLRAITAVQVAGGDGEPNR